MLDIFVNTWGNYNTNGADGGKWISLPMEEDELHEVLGNIAKLMGDNDPEWTIHDYEWTSEIELRSISEYESITALNQELLDMEVFNEYELEEIVAAMDAFGYEFAEASYRQQKGYFTFYSGMDLEEVAEEIVNDCYFTKDTPEILTRYFDYEAFARDLGFDGYVETKYGVIYDN